MRKQTLARPVTFQGLGIHSGKTVTLSVEPNTGEGLRFFRKDHDDHCIPISPSTLSSQNRATRFTHQGISILTPEHLFAALHACTITDADIYIDAEEVPIMDGSALAFFKGLSDAGTTPLSSQVDPIVISEPLTVQQDDALIIALPSEQTSFSYRLSYDNFIGHQFFMFTPHTDTFETEVAPARTYGFEHEIKALREQGLALGGSLENAIVIGEDHYLNPLRFENELCRHKCLDLFGDLWTLGRPIKGHIIGIKSGHALTMQMTQRLWSHTH